VQPAKETVYRSYSPAEVRESIRLASSQRPFFTPGFDPALALVHATRIRDFEKSGGPYPSVDATDTITSDTGGLAWHRDQAKQSVVTIDTNRSQAVIGFVKHAGKPPRNFAATVENEFCAITLTSLEDKPISQADRLLLITAARSANTGMKWNDKRTTLTDWGTEPTLIEPVKGFVTLRGIESARQIEAVPLDSGAKPIGKPIPAEETQDGYRIPVGEPATPWYLIRILRATSSHNTG
jgi:hypothetical protein